MSTEKADAAKTDVAVDPKEASSGVDGSKVPESEQEKLKLLVSEKFGENEIKNNDKENIDHININAKKNNDLIMYPYRVRRLDDICVGFISLNFNEYPILDCIPSQYIESVVELIDLSKLLINRASKHVQCESLWERMSCERWSNVNVEFHGSSWKRLYLEKHICELLESYYPSSGSANADNLNLNRLLESIECSSPFIHSIKLSQLPSHIDLSEILPLFKNLSLLDITYKILSVGMNYNESDFGLNLNDALNISKYLQNTKNLSILKLAECLIDDETIHILMGGLQQNNTITHLDLSHNKISDVGARRLGSWLKNNENVLIILNLSDNKIGTEGVQFICDALKSTKHCHLSTLNLSLNRLKNDGAIILFEAISINDTINNLDISCNEITSNAAFSSFIQMLKINNNLNELNMSGNQIISNSNSNNNDDDDIDNFKQFEFCLLNDNKTIIDINIKHIGLSKLQIITIQKILHPRKVKLKQSKRKNFIDKSWKRLQTVLTVK